MECKCNPKRCSFTRKNYNFVEEQGRTSKAWHDKVNIACSEPKCTNPNNIDTLSAGTTYPAEIKDYQNNVLCTGNECNVNSNRGGTWTCFQQNGVAIPAGQDVPRRGYRLFLIEFIARDMMRGMTRGISRGIKRGLWRGIISFILKTSLYCKLTCSADDSISMKKKINCIAPHLENEDQYRGLWRTYKQLTKNKWKKHHDALDGWMCT